MVSLLSFAVTTGMVPRAQLSRRVTKSRRIVEIRPVFFFCDMLGAR